MENARVSPLLQKEGDSLMVSIDDQLQSISGDLLGVRIAIDAEDEYNAEVAKLLSVAQTLIDQARKLSQQVWC